MTKTVNIIKIVILTVFFISFTCVKAQKLSSFKRLTPPEKHWVIFHLFIAKKTYKISIKAKNIADSLATDTNFDGDKSGGQVDALRHALWMAMLSQKYYWRKVYKLGIAHEKGNYYQYKKHKTEDGTLPDKISSDMDLLNNDAGRQIGLDNRKASVDSLIVIIKQEIKSGNLWIIKKNKNGEFLDQYDKIISKEILKGKWENNKCLVKSNYKRPK